MTTILSPERIEEIRKRADAATEGPWDYQRTRDTHKGKDYYEIYPMQEADDVFYRRDDAVFIANSRTDIPALLADRAELQSENASLRLQLDEENARKKKV